MRTKKQRGYPIKDKLAAVDLIERIKLTAVIEKLGHRHGTVDGLEFEVNYYPKKALRLLKNVFEPYKLQLQLGKVFPTST
ncbi:hypothetical protein PInf_014204 [Phytophthora infestans]|nr:hypothetical protein PInf_014204 [Phytophthora infestans]